MKTRTGCKLLVIAALAAGAGASLAQAPSQAVPHVGQRGKDVMWVATAPPLVERMLDMANVTENDFLVDLGSGDGVVVIAAGRRGARALGIENDPGLIDLARRRAAEAGVASRVTFVQGDLFERDFSAATVVFMYLTEHLNMRLRPRLLSLRPGTRVLSQPFSLGDWEPDASVTVYSFRSLLAPFLKTDDHCFFRCTGYMWIVPAVAAGRWAIPDGTLELTQRFQVVDGTLTHRGRAHRIAEGRIRGDEIVFAAGAARYTGRIAEGSISGTAVQGGATLPWSAVRLR